MDHIGRLRSVAETLDDHHLDALLVSKLTNIRYLCGFTGSTGYLLVGKNGSWFVTDGRYRIQAASEVVGAEVVVPGMVEETGPALLDAARALGAARVGFESEHLTVASAERLRGWVEGLEVAGTEGVVERLRRVKEPRELELMREAARIADEGFEYVLNVIEAGRTEREIALDLEFFLRRSGADETSFDPIVAAAERSALPHAHPTDRRVERGRWVLFDLGCRVEGYCSDMTRTVAVGEPDDRHREIYELVLNAQEAGLGALEPGVTGADADRAAREVIEKAGYGESFGHGLGHGVGLEVHEAPVLRRTSADVLEPGNVVTVEPGVYIDGWGGVRIEDLVVVTESGSEVLSKASKDLIVL